MTFRATDTYLVATDPKTGLKYRCLARFKGGMHECGVCIARACAAYKGKGRNRKDGGRVGKRDAACQVCGAKMELRGAHELNDVERLIPSRKKVECADRRGRARRNANKKYRQKWLRHTAIAKSNLTKN